MRNWHNLITKLKLKIQLLKKLKFKIHPHQGRLTVANHIVKKTVQSKLGEFNNSIKNMSWKLKTLKRRKRCLKKNSRLYKNLQKDFNEKRGIFQTKFCNVMDNIKLQCQVYHNGALIFSFQGSCLFSFIDNDVHKLTKNENIINLSTVFKPLRKIIR